MNNEQLKAITELEIIYVSHDALLDAPFPVPVGITKLGRATNLMAAKRAEKRCLNGLVINALFVVGEKGEASFKASKALEAKAQEVFAEFNRAHVDTGNVGENYWLKPETIVEWIEENTDYKRIF